MKSLYLLTFLLGVSSCCFSQFDFSGHVHSADSLHQAYEVTMDSVFENVDFSYIPSGILYERGFPFLNIEFFNRTFSGDN